MKIVLDANAAVEVSLGRSQASRVVDFLTDATHVLAPDLFYSEVGNVMWKYVRFHKLEVEKAARLLETCCDLIDDAIPSRSIYEEAFSFACSYAVSVYDALYIVSARRTDSRLVSLDQRLIKAAQKAKVSCISINKPG